MLVNMMLYRWVTNPTLLMRSLQIENVHVPIMNTSLAIQDKNSPKNGILCEHSGGVCTLRDNDEGVYKTLVSPTLCSDLVER